VSVNIISEYRKHYLKERIDGADPAVAHKDALESIYIKLIHASASTCQPVHDRSVQLIKDLNSNPHFQLLLEEIMDQPVADQKEYLRTVAKVPDLRLVK
jgi:hypothetical protein